MIENKIPATGTVIKLIFFITAVLGAPNIKDGPNFLDDQDEARRLVSCKTSQTFPNLSEFGFNSCSVSSEDSACLALTMFKEMGLLQQFHIPLEKLSRFIFQAQRSYRRVPYHNWDHGFDVLHFSFAFLKNCKYVDNKFFTPLEGLALLTAAMCHDLDHPGTNSQHQETINSQMAQKYKDNGSILERHHIEKTLEILKNPETNFVAQLSEDEHQQFLDLVRQIILATDLKTHFKVQLEEEQMANQGFNETNERHRHLLRSVVISAADLSNQAKDWDTARRLAKRVYTEFFNQGDEEKKIGIVPLKMMDREQTNVAEDQTKFISNVIMPLFRVLSTVCPETQVCIDNMERNLKYWQKAIPYVEEQSNRGRDQLDILDDAELKNFPNLYKEE